MLKKGNSINLGTQQRREEAELYGIVNNISIARIIIGINTFSRLQKQSTHSVLHLSPSSSWGVKAAAAPAFFPTAPRATPSPILSTLTLPFPLLSPPPGWCIQQPREIKRRSLRSLGLRTDLTFPSSLD